jgi:hypothetical protein
MFIDIRALVMMLLAALSAGPATARDPYDRYQDRSEARRAGVIAGAVTYGVVRNIQDSDDREDREACYRNTHDYDYCDLREYRDDQQERRQARRTAVVVGVGTTAIVRSNRRRD